MWRDLIGLDSGKRKKLMIDDDDDNDDNDDGDDNIDR